jgi:hypothetical protein
VTSHHRAKGGLSDLADRRFDVLDRDHRTDRILHPVIGDSGHIDADVVLGDDPLRLNRHCHDPQRHTTNPLHERHDKDQPQPARLVPDLPEVKHDCTLVLLDDVRHDHGSFFLDAMVGPAG